MKYRRTSNMKRKWRQPHGVYKEKPIKLATKKFQVKKTQKTDELERKGRPTKIEIKSKEEKKNLCCGSPKARAERCSVFFLLFYIAYSI